MNTTVDYGTITREAIDDITKQISSLSMLGKSIINLKTFH